MSDLSTLNRRRFIQAFGGVLLGTHLPVSSPRANPASTITRPIPSTGQRIPVIGMGTWISFNVGNDPLLRDRRGEVLRTFFEQGGQLIDSSPMYGSAEAVLGYCLDRSGALADPLFSATKVWTSNTEKGREQIADSQRLWGIRYFNLFQVHNLVNWQKHLETLFEMKANQQLQYVGITTSHGRRHSDLEEVMTTQPIDFVQLTYHMQNREVEKRLLPLALEKGIAVIANRPFSGGRLIDYVQQHRLPDWSHEIDCTNWAQFLLKYIVSHPAITCAIPATSQVEHMIENMGAGRGQLPDSHLRQKMLDYVNTL